MVKLVNILESFSLVLDGITLTHRKGETVFLSDEHYREFKDRGLVELRESKEEKETRENKIRGLTR